MKIAFHIYTFSFRGTEIATYDYAHFSETILGNQSIIVAPKKIHQNNHQQTIEKFVSRFPLYLYDDMENLEKYLIKEKVDAMYVIKYGLKDEVELKNIPMLIHCVYKIGDDHGLVYAGVSESIAQKNVSHIVNIPKNPSFSKDILRKKMNIPNDAIVFGRSGGMDSFCLEGVKETITEIVYGKKTLYSDEFHSEHQGLIEINDGIVFRKIINKNEIITGITVVFDTKNLEFLKDCKLEVLCKDAPPKIYSSIKTEDKFNEKLNYLDSKFDVPIDADKDFTEIKFRIFSNFINNLNVEIYKTIYHMKHKGLIKKLNEKWTSALTLNETSNQTKNIYFLFMPRPYLLNDVPESDRIRYLPSTSDLQVKRDFIEVCDAMLHAQILGETQGLSVLEFSYCNKPVITWNGGQVKQHLKNLGDKAIKYNDEKELYSILTNFNSVYEEKNKVLKGNWRVTEKFSPKHIMKQFDKVFLEPVRNLSVKNLL